MSDTEPRLRAVIERETPDGGTEKVLSVEGSWKAVRAALEVEMNPERIVWFPVTHHHRTDGA